MKGEITGKHEGIFIDRFNEGSRAINSLRILFNIQPTIATQLLFKLRQIDIDGIHFHHDFQTGIFNIFRIEIQRGIKLSEAAQECGEAQMIELEQQRSMVAIKHILPAPDLGDFSSLIRRHKPIAGTKESNTGDESCSSAQTGFS